MISRKELYMEGYKYLVEIIGEVDLQVELDFYSGNSVHSLREVYMRILISLQNRQGYMNFLEPIDGMKDTLFDYDCHAVFGMYEGNTELLVSKLADVYPDEKIDPMKKRSAWYQYVKGIISGAGFLSQFANLEEFEMFVDSFSRSKNTIPALPMVLDHEIHGFGFALACDFLKEIGYQDYGKPDVHLHDILKGVGMVPATASDYEVAKEISAIAQEAGVTAAVVDKVFWMIGSGKFVQSKREVPRQKKKFIDKINTKYM